MSIIATTGAIVMAGASIPYITAVRSGDARPRMVSWAVWTLLAGIMAASALSEGQVPSALLSAVTFVGCCMIVGFGWRTRTRGLTLLDKVCLAGTALGVVALIVLKDPFVATVIALVVDAIAFVPTLVHAWRQPYEESLACFSLSMLGGGLALLAAAMTEGTLMGMLYPAYALLFNGAVALVIMVGRFPLFGGYRSNPEEV